MSATQTASRTTTALRRSMNLELQDDDAAHKGELAPLTSDMKREIYELKAAYEEFWQQRKFKKGWAKPLFAFDEAVEELLAQAAEIVVRIRSHFDELASSGVGTGVVLSKSAPALATHTKHLPRFKEGRAREHLWSLEQDPRAAPQQFVRDIVHATLSHEDGYLEEGLTADKVDRYIDKILAYMRQRDEQEAQATAQLEEKLKRRWDKTEKLLQTFCGLEADRKANKSYYGSLRKIIKRVDDVREELKLMLSRVDTNASRPQVEEERQASETPSAEAETQTEKGEPEATANVTVEDKASEVKEVEGEEKKDESRETTDGSVATTSSSEPETGEAETTETTESAQPAAAESEGTKPETTETVDSAQSEAAESEDSASATPNEDEPVKQAEEGENKEESGDDSSISDEERQRIEQEKQKAMLKIKSVADSVTRLSDQIEGFASEATRLDVEELQKEPESAEKTLSRLQKQCLFYSENLMKDLLSLDAISTGSALQDEASDEVRPLRKQQVKEIQGLLQDVDQVNTKLKAMLKKIQDEKQRREEQRKKQEMDERAKQPQQQEQPQPPQQQQQQEKEEEQQTNNLWRTLKLKPKFEMAQTADGIILQAYIPGMKEEDIEIERDDDGRTFTVKGLRVPTPAEEAALRRQLKSGLARDPWGLYYPQGEQERDLLLRLGAGRYGAFAETFEVGPEMDLYGITASYTKGVLRILVPAAAPAAGKPRRPRHQQQAPYGQNPFFGGMPQQRRRQPAAHRGYGGAPQGFFDDKSFWW